jgi:hypothetical protein
LVAYNALIWCSIGVIVILGALTSVGKISDTWSTAGIGIVVGVILFIISLKIGETSMLTLFVLLDDRKRRILELLEVYRDIGELVSLLRISDDERANLINTLHYLKKKRFIKEKQVLGTKKFIRSFYP